MAVDGFGNGALNPGAPLVGLAEGWRLLSLARGQNRIVVNAELQGSASDTVRTTLPKSAGLALGGGKADLNDGLPVMLLDRGPVGGGMPRWASSLLLGPVDLEVLGRQALRRVRLPTAFGRHCT